METAINKLPEDINYMFYIKPKGAKRFSTYNPGQGTMGTGRVFTELYRKEHLQKVCDWIAEDESGDYVYQLRSGDGKKIYWEHNPIDASQPTETPRISTETAETVNVSAEGGKTVETAKYRISRLGGYKIIVGDREQGKVIAVLMVINEHNTIEINDESAHIATMGEKTLEIDKPIMQLSDAEVLKLIYNRTEPSQSSETPQTIKRTTDTPKPRETAWKPQNRGIGSTRHSRLGANGYAMLDNANATLTAMCVPRQLQPIGSPDRTLYWWHKRISKHFSNLAKNKQPCISVKTNSSTSSSTSCFSWCSRAPEESCSTSMWSMRFSRF